MAERLTRRQALVTAGGAALGGGAAVGALAGVADAATPTVRGSWLFTPTTQAGPAGFQAISAFAAGGVFVTIGSDEPGTGIGEWISIGKNGFGFTYLNFHFAPDQKPSNTVKVRAKGTFKGNTLKGKATLTMTDPAGHSLGPARPFAFTGKRIAVQSP